MYLVDIIKEIDLEINKLNDESIKISIDTLLKRNIWKYYLAVG